MKPDTQHKPLLRKPRPSKQKLPKLKAVPPVDLTVTAFDDLDSFTLTDSKFEADISPETSPVHFDSKASQPVREVTYIDGASPPPPSELSTARSTTAAAPTIGHVYILDRSCRQPTELGTYVEGQALNRPNQIRGPDPLPPRAPLQRPSEYYVEHEENWERYQQQPTFRLNDFLLKVSEVGKMEMSLVSRLMLSKRNYKRLQEMLFNNFICTQNPSVAKISLQPPEYGYPTGRIPQRQLVIEMAALIKQQMSEIMQMEMIPKIRPLPKYHPNYRPDEPRPHTEIVLYEASGKKEKPVDKRLFPKYPPLIISKALLPGGENDAEKEVEDTKSSKMDIKDATAVTLELSSNKYGREDSPEKRQRLESTNVTSQGLRSKEGTIMHQGIYKEHNIIQPGVENESTIVTQGVDKEPSRQVSIAKHSHMDMQDQTFLTIQQLASGTGTLKTLESRQPTDGEILQSGSVHHFQGSRRSHSPFTMQDDDVISPTELAILDSLLAGGSALSLKAHFIQVLPSIGGLTATLRYLNLSFNCFTDIPAEVFDVEHLETLKVRDNPLQAICGSISQLKTLKTLVLSFCLLSELPVELFQLPSLTHLDVAYNKIAEIPIQIGQLTSLEELNIEGNQLTGLPGSSFQLKNLRYLCLRNNFMHPLFWRERSVNSPPKLADLAATACRQPLPLVLQRHTPSISCEVCHRPQYGPGLQFIRPVTQMFGVKCLPIIFTCCTPSCYNRSRKDKQLVSKLLNM